MAMVDDVVLRQLFRDTLLAVSGIPREKTHIAWENRAFDPPDFPSAPGPLPLWVQEQFRILDETKSSTGHIEAVGEILWLIHTPKGRGTEAADKLARAIAEKFQAGQSLTKAGVTANLEHTERRPYRQSVERPVWVFKTVATTWRNFTVA